MSVDVLTEIIIQKPRADVAAFATSAENAPRWYLNIKSATSETPGPLRLGSRLTFTARFLGRSLAYTYDVTEFEASRRLVMRTAEGPFPMETTYTWDDAGPGATRMTLRNRGEPTGFSRIAAPMMSRAMKRANEKDLARLKALLESS